MSKKKKIVRGFFRNPKQWEFLSARQKRKTFNAGRGLGKSFSIGDHNYLKFRNMPRAKSLLVNKTFYQLLTKTVVPMEQAWNDWGLREYDPKTGDGHYVFGRKPPKGWFTCFNKPRNYEYCYSFLNGYTIELASVEQKDRIRGGNNDALDADESATIPEDVWNSIILPTVRANKRGKNKIDSYLHHSICDFTSAPWILEGKWIYKVRELAKKHPDKYYFLSASTLDNIDVLGEEYINRLRETMLPLEYYVEILNKEIDKQPDGGFYPALSAERHLKSDTFEYDWDSNGRMTIKRENFIDPTQPFIFSLDFNVKFTSGIVCQEIVYPNSRELRICDNLYEQPDPMKDMNKEAELLIDRLVDSFCKKYIFHPVKYIEIDGDGSAKNLRVGAPAIFEQVKARFRHHGWQAIIKALPKLPFHQTRYLLINNILRGGNAKYPRIVFNEHTTKQLVMSMQFAPVTSDFQKDKSSERKEKIDQTMATHLSDCFDYVVMRKYGSLIEVGSTSVWSSLIPSARS